MHARVQQLLVADQTVTGKCVIMEVGFARAMIYS